MSRMNGDKLPWEEGEQTTREFSGELKVAEPITELEARIVGVYTKTGSGLATLHCHDRDEKLTRPLFISSGFGCRQLAGAGVTMATWLRFTIDGFGVVVSFEVIEGGT